MTKINKILSFSLFAIILLFMSSYAPSNKSDWKLYKSIKGVNIYSKIAKCNTEYNTAENDYYVFKYVNTNKYNIRISWELDLWVNDVCRSCDLSSPNEYELSLDIAAGQTLKYVCSDNNKAFKIFKSSKKANINQEIKFEFSNLRAEEI